ncbi:MAG: transporter substrate-binding domain-containing protein, partial [Actinobacteria bacterium]|nr:transporter substrate-binding domain-containing protein [Actinomycetota bacterium]
MNGRTRGGRPWMLALLGALVLTVAACGADEEPTAPGGGGDTSEAGLNLVKEGHLVVGSDIPYPPFEFEEGGSFTGFDVDLIREIADRIGLENEDGDWISTDWGTIFQQLQTGANFDVIAGAATAYAPKDSPAGEEVAKRKKLVDFTIHYYDSLQALTVNTETNPDVQSVEDLDGKRVGIQRATTGGFYAEEKLTPLGAELVTFEKAPPMYQQLQARQLDAIFNDLPVTLESIKDRPELEVMEQVETGEQYGFAVSKDNP